MMKLAARRLRLAYLCNVYPAVSHTFVRREIESLTLMGYDVARYSIRPHGKNLINEADRVEAESTTVILDGRYAKFVGPTIAALLRRPRGAIKALFTALQMSGGIRHALKHGAYLLEAAWLARELAGQDIDHLHVHFGTNPATVAYLAHMMGGPPFSFTVHGPDEFDAPATLALTQKINAASFVAAVSSFGRGQLMRWSDVDQWSKIKVVRCGVDDAFLQSVPQAAPDSLEFCCIARLSSQKGLPLLIEACALLDARGKEFSVTIIGDGPMKRVLLNMILAEGLDQRVSLVGSKSGHEIRDYLLRSRALILPSFAEGLPVVLMESLALHRPVIATNVAGIAELVDGRCGWLVPSGSVNALCVAMNDALEASPANLVDMGRIGHARVERMHRAMRGAELIASYIGDARAQSEN